MNSAIQVLVVESRQKCGRTVKSMLETAGPKIFDVQLAGSWEWASKFLNRISFDVILADVNLIKDGSQDWSSIVNECPNIPLIAVGGVHDSGLMLKAMEQGAYNCVFRSELTQATLMMLVHSSIDSVWNRALKTA